jgi:hypothetical protein
MFGLAEVATLQNSAVTGEVYTGSEEHDRHVIRYRKPRLINRLRCHLRFTRVALTLGAILIKSRTCPDAINDKRNPDSTKSPSPEVNEKEEVICYED